MTVVTLLFQVVTEFATLETYHVSSIVATDRQNINGQVISLLSVCTIHQTTITNVEVKEFY